MNAASASKSGGPELTLLAPFRGKNSGVSEAGAKRECGRGHFHHGRPTRSGSANQAPVPSPVNSGLPPIAIRGVLEIGALPAIGSWSYSTLRRAIARSAAHDHIKAGQHEIELRPGKLADAFAEQLSLQCDDLRDVRDRISSQA